MNKVYVLEYIEPFTRYILGIYSSYKIAIKEREKQLSKFVDDVDIEISEYEVI